MGGRPAKAVARSRLFDGRPQPGERVTLAGFDGVLLSNGELLSDGVVYSDSYFASSIDASTSTAMAQAALNGDNSSAMNPSVDSDPLD